MDVVDFDLRTISSTSLSVCGQCSIKRHRHTLQFWVLFVRVLPRGIRPVGASRSVPLRICREPSRWSQSAFIPRRLHCVVLRVDISRLISSVLEASVPMSAGVS